jgi:hypothetical protein
MHLMLILLATDDVCKLLVSGDNALVNIYEYCILLVYKIKTAGRLPTVICVVRKSGLSCCCRQSHL